MAACEVCGGDIRYGKCRECGAVDQHAAPGVRAEAPALCPFDGARLYANGWCEVGNGYPITRSCPFVCDRCRKTLTWGGTCLSCPEHAPGDRYDYDAKQGHWQQIEKGPFVILPLEQQAQRAAEFKRTLESLVAKLSLDPVRPRRPRDADGDDPEDMGARARKAQAMLQAFRAHNARGASA